MDEPTHFVGGKHVRGASGRFAEGFEPMTGQAISRVPLASKAEVRAAVENAVAAQPAWAATNPQRRATRKNRRESTFLFGKRHFTRPGCSPWDIRSHSSPNCCRSPRAG